jgi:hypothetical protein
MAIDPLLWMDLGRRWKNFARSLDLLLQNGILSCYAQVLPVQTADLGTPNPETRNIANIQVVFMLDKIRRSLWHLFPISGSCHHPTIVVSPTVVVKTNILMKFYKVFPSVGYS